MEVVPVASTGELANLVADVVEDVVRSDPSAVLGVATGSTPLPVYRELIRRHDVGAGPCYGGVHVVLLDEYVGLPPGHPQTYRSTIARELTDGLGLPPERVHGPDAGDLDRAGDRYEALLGDLGGVSVQILGIGSDGHLAFNEPGSALTSRTRIKTLTDQTRRDNARFFQSVDDVPSRVVTQGLGTILDAARLLLLADGGHKARAVAAAVEGPLTASCPASVIQLHPRATVIATPEAASGLERLDYYQAVQAATKG